MKTSGGGSLQSLLQSSGKESSGTKSSGFESIAQRLMRRGGASTERSGTGTRTPSTVSSSRTPARLVFSPPSESQQGSKPGSPPRDVAASADPSANEPLPASLWSSALDSGAGVLLSPDEPHSFPLYTLRRTLELDVAREPSQPAHASLRSIGTLAAAQSAPIPAGGGGGGASGTAASQANSLSSLFAQRSGTPSILHVASSNGDGATPMLAVYCSNGYLMVRYVEPTGQAVLRYLWVGRDEAHSVLAMAFHPTGHYLALMLASGFLLILPVYFLISKPVPWSPSSSYSSSSASSVSSTMSSTTSTSTSTFAAPMNGGRPASSTAPSSPGLLSKGSGGSLQDLSGRMQARLRSRAAQWMERVRAPVQSLAQDGATPRQPSGNLQAALAAADGSGQLQRLARSGQMVAVPKFRAARLVRALWWRSYEGGEYVILVFSRGTLTFVDIANGEVFPSLKLRLELGDAVLLPDPRRRSMQCLLLRSKDGLQHYRLVLEVERRPRVYDRILPKIHDLNHSNPSSKLLSSLNPLSNSSTLTSLSSNSLSSNLLSNSTGNLSNSLNTGGGGGTIGGTMGVGGGTLGGGGGTLGGGGGGGGTIGGGGGGGGGNLGGSGNRGEEDTNHGYGGGGGPYHPLDPFFIESLGRFNGQRVWVQGQGNEVAVLHPGSWRLEIYGPELGRFPLYVVQLMPDVVELLVTERLLFCVTVDSHGRRVLAVVSRLLSAAGPAPPWRFARSSILQQFALPDPEPVRGLLAARDGGGLLWTSRGVFSLRKAVSPEALFSRLLLVEQRRADAETLGKALNLDLLALYERAADRTFADGGYRRALELYLLGHASPAKLVRRFLRVGRPGLVLAYLATKLSSADTLAPAPREALADLRLSLLALRTLAEPTAATEKALLGYVRESPDYNASNARIRLSPWLPFRAALVTMASARPEEAEAILETIWFFHEKEKEKQTEGALFAPPKLGIEERTLAERIWPTRPERWLDALKPDKALKRLLADPTALQVSVDRLLAALPCLTPRTLETLAMRLDPRMTPHFHKLPSLSLVSTELYLTLLLVLCQRYVTLSKEADPSSTFTFQPPSSEIDSTLLPSSEESTTSSTSMNKESEALKQVRRNEKKKIREEVGRALRLQSASGYGGGGVGVGHDGEVYEWDLPRLEVRLVQGPRPGGTSVRRVACGRQFALALLDDGAVYGWGDGRDGQLGEAAQSAGHVAAHAPVRVPLPEVPQSVACGAAHAVFVTADGDVYAQGRNDRGQLGLGHTRPSNVARRVPGAPGGVAMAACGDAHSLFLTPAGRVYGCGAHEAVVYPHTPRDASSLQPLAGLLREATVRLLASAGSHALLWTDLDNVFYLGASPAQPSRASLSKILEAHDVLALSCGPTPFSSSIVRSHTFLFLSPSKMDITQEEEKSTPFHENTTTTTTKDETIPKWNAKKTDEMTTKKIFSSNNSNSNSNYSNSIVLNFSLGIQIEEILLEELKKNAGERVEDAAAVGRKPERVVELAGGGLRWDDGTLQVVVPADGVRAVLHYRPARRSNEGAETVRPPPSLGAALGSRAARGAVATLQEALRMHRGAYRPHAVAQRALDLRLPELAALVLEEQDDDSSSDRALRLRLASLHREPRKVESLERWGAAVLGPGLARIVRAWPEDERDDLESWLRSRLPTVARAWRAMLPAVARLGLPPSFYKALLVECARLREDDAAGRPEASLWRDVRAAAARDAGRRTRVLVSAVTLQAADDWVAFSCGEPHVYTRGDLVSTLLPKFERLMRKLPATRPVPVAPLLAEYARSAPRIACPICVYNLFRDELRLTDPASEWKAS